MRIIGYLAGLLLLSLPLCVSAEDADAIAAAFPGQKWNVWVSAKGDLNNDRVADLAAILTRDSKDGPREEVLSVLVGQAEGGYSVLSVSSSFCQVRYHYEMDIRKGSLFVTGYPNLTGSSFRLQFRYNSKNKDLVLIGQDREEQDEKGQSSEKVSINYLSGTVVSVCRKGQKRNVSQAKINNRIQMPLSQFNCGEHYVETARPCKE